MEQNVSEDEGMKPLLMENQNRSEGNRVVGILKAKRWLIMFVCAIVLAIAIIVTFVATKSSSSSNCKFNSDSEACFFKGSTRLPSNLKPATYTIRLQPSLDTFLFNGSSQMTVNCLENTKRIVFHQKGLSFDQSSVSIQEEFITRNTKKESKEIQIDKIRFDTEHEQVIIRTKSLLVAGKEYTITVTFKGKLNEKLEGFYKSSYKTRNGVRYLATTHFEATAARQAFPCFDEPALKANFTIIIVHQLQYVALSNMPVERSRILPNNLNETIFMPSVKMSSYLVAFVVCDFKYIENTTAHGIKVRVWAPPEEIHEAPMALESASVILDYYEDYFNVRYPLPKQDLIAIPDFSAGAMENWGLITYRLTSLLADPKQSSSSSMEWVVRVVAHELAHQWFGNLVTMEWWDDLWLNEGFATYMESIGGDIFRPKWKMMDQFILNNIQRSMGLDQLANSHPISVVVKNPSEISSLFDDISYHKGASLIYMLNAVLGQDVFHKGLQSYLDEYKFGNAATKNLWSSFSKFTGGKIDVGKVMDTWTLQMGFPLVTITKQDGMYQATQEHFLIDPDSKPTQKSPYDYKWYIPLTYRTDSDETPRLVWMNKKDATINVDVAEDGWLKANYRQTGFYRVNYPVEMWKNIIKTLNVDHEKFSAADRAGLIDDAFALARAGKLSYNLALDMTSYLHNEKEYIVWSTAVGALGYIASRFAVTPYYGIYQDYLLSKATPVLDQLSYDDKGEHLERYLRDLLFSEAAAYDYKNAKDKANELFQGFMQNKRVDANFRGLVYSYGVRNGGKEEWEFMWHKYNKELVAEEKNLLMMSLTGSRRPWLLQRCLENSLNSSVIKSQDADTVIAGVAGNSNGRLLAWDFFRLNWEELQKRYASEAFSFGRLIKSVVLHFQSEFHFNEVKSFFDTHSDVGAALRSLQQSYEIIKHNIHWMEKHQKEVVQWLIDHKTQ